MMVRADHLRPGMARVERNARGRVVKSVPIVAVDPWSCMNHVHVNYRGAGHTACYDVGAEIDTDSAT